MMQTEILIGLVVAVIFLVIVVPTILSMVRIIQEYERIVIFRFGKEKGVRGPGVALVLPFIERVQSIDLRLRVIEIPRQEVMSIDNVPVSTNAICFYRVNNPIKAIIEVERYQEAVYQLAQATTRSVVGQSHLDDVLSNRDHLNEQIKKTIGDSVSAWGIEITAVEIKDVELPDSMKRAMARQAEAERDKRGRIIQAEGEETASKLLADAAKILRGSPQGLHLRTLQTLTEIGAENPTKTVMVIPIETLGSFKHKSK
jgi:regulator of protease activity HflC (stomatin/prohibitin superfamily)